MAKFEVGKKYFTSDSYGDGSIYEWTITKRTDSFCTVERNGDSQRVKIKNYAWEDGTEEALHINSNFSLYAKNEVGTQKYIDAKDPELKVKLQVAQMMGTA